MQLFTFFFTLFTLLTFHFKITKATKFKSESKQNSHQNCNSWFEYWHLWSIINLSSTIVIETLICIINISLNYDFDMLHYNFLKQCVAFYFSTKWVTVPHVITPTASLWKNDLLTYIFKNFSSQDMRKKMLFQFSTYQNY